METGTQPAHVSIALPLDPETPQEDAAAHPNFLSQLPPPTSSPLTSAHTHHQAPHTMHSDRVYYSASAYPREADSDCETDDSRPTMEELEDPLPPLVTPPTTPLTPSPPHSPFSPSHLPSSVSSSSSSSFPLTEPILRHQASISDDLLCTICTCVLHDPMSLHCGHSFCQLCLACMWKNAREPESAARLNCPVCRKSWRNFPGVNIQLRNIIERTYPKRCEERAFTMQSEDRGLLQRFKQARDKESQVKDKASAPLRQEEVRRLVSGLCCLFFIVIVILVLLFSLLFWAWAGAGGEFMRKPAAQWSREDVAEWVGGLGDWATHNYSQLFLGEHINGQRLLQLDEAALKAIGVKNEYRRHSILYGIQELRDAEYSIPRTFDEFKAANRRQTLVIALLYTLWPRFTLIYVYYFNYYEIFLPFMRYDFPAQEEDVVMGEMKVDMGEVESPGGEEERGDGGFGGVPVAKDEEVGERDEGVKATTAEQDSATVHTPSQALVEPSARELVAMFIQLMLIPHFLVALFAWSWAGSYPWIAYPIIVHCLWRMWGEGKTVVQWVRSQGAGLWQVANWKVKIRQIFTSLFKVTLQFIFLFFVITMLWHVTPHFVCDMIFYYLVWQTMAYSMCIAPLLRCCGVRGAGNNNFQARFQMNFRGPGARQRQQLPNLQI